MLESKGKRPQIQKPEDIAALMMPEMSNLEQEHFRVLLLDIKNHVLSTQTLYIGSSDMIPVQVREIFRDAVRRSVPAIAMVHNHPSGDPTPSPEDISLTHQAVNAGKLLDVAVIDHVIIGRGKYTSLKERGLGGL